MAVGYRGSEIKRERVLANFRVPKWKQEKKPSWRSLRPGNDHAHQANIRKLQCSVCAERRYVQIHHLRGGPAAKERGVAMKSSDRWGVPLCPPHHDEHSHIGSRKEEAWFEQFGIDCYALANALWSRRGSAEDMARVLLAHQLAAVAQKGRPHAR